MLIHDDSSKKRHVIFKKDFFLFAFFGKFLGYLVCVPIFQPIDSNSLSRKKHDEDNFTPRQRL